jgi:nicotinamide riboside kinase
MWQLLIHPLTGGTRWEADGQRIGPLAPQRMNFDHHLRTLQDPDRTR